MWRSIASRSSSFTGTLGRKIFSLNHSPPSQVITKTLNSSSQLPRSTTLSYEKNYRFFSNSPVEDETHEHTSSSSSDEVESEPVKGFEDILEIFNIPDDDIENSDAQMDSFSSNDQGNEGVVGIDAGKLEKVLSLLQSSVDGSLEFSLDHVGLKVSEEFVIRVLETPLVPGDSLIRFFKWVSSKNKFTVSNSLLGVLAHAICDEPKRNNTYAFWDLVKEIGEKESGVVSAEILNQLLSALSRLGKGKAALEVFDKFEGFGCVPNSDSYYLTIEALCRRSFHDWAVPVCQKMLASGILPEREKIGDIISFLCKGRKDKDAYAVYLTAKEKSLYPPQKPVNFLISRLSKKDGTVHLAQQMLEDFSSEVRKHSINPFSWVVRGLCRKKDNEGAKKLLYGMIEKGPPPGNAVFNSVINSLSKAGDLDDAKEMLKLTESRGLKPDVYAYSVVISGYAKGGLMEEACAVLSEARIKHRKLHPVTFHSLIRGYCKLEEFDKALKLLSEMEKYGVKASVDEYNKLIQSLCLKALDWETAEKLLEEMRVKGLYLPGITRGLISAVKELEQESAVSEGTVTEV